MLSLKALAFSAITTTICVAVPMEVSRLAHIPPDQDLFYSIPSNVSAYELGSIISRREVLDPKSMFGDHPVNIQRAEQMLYRTSNTFGDATATVTTLLTPFNADTGKLLSYQIAEDAAWSACAPSYVLQGVNASKPSEILLIEAALERGWMVSVPDHEGPTSAFLATVAAGHAILDGFRAVLSSGVVNPDANLAMWGYSDGSFTTASAAEQQTSYAPDLNIAGAAIGGVVPNITSVLTTVDNGSYAGLIAAGFLGLTHEYPALKRVVSEHLLPEKSDKFKSAEHQCWHEDRNAFQGEDILSYFDDRDLPYKDPTAVQVLLQNALGQGAVPSIPLLIYKSVYDEISPVADTDELVRAYCAGGASVEYHRDHLSKHVSLGATGAPLAFQWLVDRMHGHPAVRGCSTHNDVTELLKRKGATALPGFVLDGLIDLLDAPERW